MKRDIGALADQEFDLVIVGAGVYGAATAWDAALRGLSVALIDKGDFGSGTSFNNLKTVHGGLRYLQHADFKRMRESIRERRNLMRIAPHLVHPLPFLVPTYEGNVLKSRPVMRAALFVNDLLSWDRNRRTDRSKYLPAGRALSRRACLELASGIEEQGLTGGVLWYDAQMYNSDRLTLSFVLSAVERGAVAANHVEALELLRDGNRVRGVRARDALTGAEGLEVRGKLVVNATGPWVDTLTGSRRKLFHLSMAMNLVTRPVVGEVAVGVTSRRPHRDQHAAIDTGGRFLFLIPWRDVTLIGTSHAPYDGSADALEVREEDVEDLIADVNAAYPRAGLRREDVRLIHRGLLPMVPGTNGSGVTLVKSYRLEDHTAEGIEGLLSIVGVKYTTARDVAEKAVDRALALLGRRPIDSRSRETPVVGGDIESFETFLRDIRGAGEGKISGDTLERLAKSYGTRHEDILSEGTEPVVPGHPVLASEVRHAIREEMAFDLASVVLRRTELGTAGHPGLDVLEACASILQSELGWDDDRKRREVEALEDFYRRRS